MEEPGSRNPEVPGSIPSLAQFNLNTIRLILSRVRTGRNEDIWRVAKGFWLEPGSDRCSLLPYPSPDNL